MSFRHFQLIIAIVLILSGLTPDASAPAAVIAAPLVNCQNTAVGFIPLIDLGTGTHKNAAGGLYPNGQNQPPAAHLNAGLALADAITPLNAAGTPDFIHGKIGLVSIGMSNTRLEFNAFQTQLPGMTTINPALTAVNGAQSGQASQQLLDPNAPFWIELERLIADAGLTPAQVQVAWIKEARASIGNESFPQSVEVLQQHLTIIVNHLKEKYPNVQIAYLSSRIYSGYATTNLSPEPHAYESGFAVKWLIEEQINGSANLNYDPARGPVRAPWLAWGPYLWADGLTPRSDGLIWECADFADDGTHPSAQGQAKVGAMLAAFFTQEATAVPWFLAPLPPLEPTVFLPLVVSGNPALNAQGWLTQHHIALK